MRRTAIALIALALAGAAGAQTERKPAPAKPAARPAAKPAPQAAPKPLVLQAAEGEQLAAAAMTHFGDYQCEFSQSLVVGLTPAHDGYVDVTFAKKVYTMKPVLSSTGALRLEDVRGRMLLLQIAFKSMLMDVESGRRVVDECVHERQIEARRVAETAPPPPTLGIDPARAPPAAAPPAMAASAAAAAPAASAAPIR